MIYYFTGDNTFELTRAVQDVVTAWVGDIVQDNAGLTNQPERVDGSELQPRDLPDLLTATTLFAQHRLVIIKGLSENPATWNTLPDLLPRLSDDIDLLLVDTKPDKRTSTFKATKAASHYREFLAWNERDTMKAITWVVDEAARQKIPLNKRMAQLLVDRAGVDQWELSHALEKLALVDALTEESIIELVDARPADNVFILFETALKGDAHRLHHMLQTFELTEDPYRLLALLSSQAFQLASLHSAKPGDSPTKDFGIAPFVATKFSSYTNRLSQKDIRVILQAFAQADADMKSSRGEPWLVIEKTLLTVAS